MYPLAWVAPWWPCPVVGMVFDSLSVNAGIDLAGSCIAWVVVICSILGKTVMVTIGSGAVVADEGINKDEKRRSRDRTRETDGLAPLRSLGCVCGSSSLLW